MSGNYKALLKQHPDIKKLFNKNIEGTNFTYEHAIRVYLWDRAGYEIPGIAEATKKKLLDAVKGIPEMNGFADSLGKITKVEQGYPEPDADWVAESIIADLANVTDEIGRAEFLQEFINNANENDTENATTHDNNNNIKCEQIQVKQTRCQTNIDNERDSI